jgi:ABC-type amino acid transport substrate-binding protein
MRYCSIHPIYSNYTNSTNVTTTTTKVGGTTDAAAAVSFDGYDPACLQELARLLSESYQVDIQLALIIIEGNNPFNDLRNAVDTDHVDMIWSVVTISEERSTQVDYVCPSHMSEYVIGASAKAGNT